MKSQSMRKMVSGLAVVGAVLGCVVFAHASLRPLKGGGAQIPPQPMQSICWSNITIGDCGDACQTWGALTAMGAATNANGQQCPGGYGSVFYLYSGSGCINSFVGCPPTNMAGLAYFRLGITKTCANCIGVRSNVLNVTWQAGTNSNNISLDMPPACTNMLVYLYQPAGTGCPLAACAWTNGGSDRSASCNNGGSPVGPAEE